MIVKVCGMREAENIRQVEQTGADWMGFIDYEGSPRYVADVPEYLPETVQKVGVFVNASLPRIRYHYIQNVYGRVPTAQYSSSSQL